MPEPTRQGTHRPPVANYQPLMIVLVAVCSGILLDRFCCLPLAAWWATAVAAWVAWLALWMRKRVAAASVLLLLSAAACGGGWFHCQWHLFADDDLARFARRQPQPACAEAVVLRGPRRVPAKPPSPMQVIPFGDRTRLDVRLVRLRDGAAWRRATGLARLNVNGHLLGVHVGDRLQILGELSVPSPACNPGALDYAAYARASRISGFLESPYPDCITVLDRPRLGDPGRWIDYLRTRGHEFLWQHLDSRQVPLAAALLLGIRDEMPHERSDLYVETGTVHLLSVSGLHVGIVAATLLFFVRLLLVPRQLGAVILAGTVVVYVVLTGAEPPAVRAAILVIMFCLGQVLGRRALPFNSLAAAALVVLVLNPADLFSVGAQLSFLSVAGILWYAPLWSDSMRPTDPLDRLILESRRWPSRLTWRFQREVRNVALLSAVVWLLTLPLVTARFHVVALAAIALSVLLWIPAFVGLATGFALLAVGWLCSPLAAVLGWCCDKALWALESLIGLARTVPASCFWVRGPSPWWLVGFYGGLGVLAAFPALRPPRRWCLALLVTWSAVGLLVPTLGRSALECTVLSVGHGCAVVVQLPTGRTLLYDAGKLAAPEAGMESIAGCLWAKGVSHLDAIVLSHADADHYNAVPELIKRFSVGAVYVSPAMFARNSRSLAVLQQALRAADIPIREICAGDCLVNVEDCRIEVLHPPQRGVSENDNANSIVLGLQYGGRRILLPGDLESPGLETLLSEEPWDCDVILAPHHGSRLSRSPELAAWCKPRWVIVSGGRSRDPRDTMNVYRDLGCQVFHTAEVGAVRVSIEGCRLEVSGFLDQNPAFR